MNMEKRDKKPESELTFLCFLELQWTLNEEGVGVKDFLSGLWFYRKDKGVFKIWERLGKVGKYRLHCGRNQGLQGSRKNWTRYNILMLWFI